MYEKLVFPKHTSVFCFAGELEVSTEGTFFVIGCENKTLQGWGVQTKQKVFFKFSSIIIIHMLIVQYPVQFNGHPRNINNIILAQYCFMLINISSNDKNYVCFH